MSAALKTADINAVKRDPNDVLGIQFNQYKNKVYSASITNPATYFEKRNEMEKLLKEVLVTEMFNTIYDLLRYGVINNNTVKDSNNINSFYGWIKEEL